MYNWACRQTLVPEQTTPRCTHRRTGSVSIPTVAWGCSGQLLIHSASTTPLLGLTPGRQANWPASLVWCSCASVILYMNQNKLLASQSQCATASETSASGTTADVCEVRTIVFMAPLCAAWGQFGDLALSLTSDLTGAV